MTCNMFEAIRCDVSVTFKMWIKGLIGMFVLADPQILNTSQIWFMKPFEMKTVCNREKGDGLMKKRTSYRMT